MPQTVLMIVWGCLGEGILAVGVGKLMGWLGYHWLIYSMLAMNLAIWAIAKINSQWMSAAALRKQQGLLRDGSEGDYEMKTIKIVRRETYSQS